MSAYFSRLAGIFLLAAGLIFSCSGTAPAGSEKEVVSNITAGEIRYTVKKGDTLSEIAQRYDVDVNILIRANNLETLVIHPEQTLVIPLGDETGTGILSRGNITREDLLLMARVIHAEARGESFMGQVAVGAVIINRVNSPFFPNSVREVIMQRNRNMYEFTPVSNGTINLEPSKSAIDAAVQALEGNDPTGGALFFYNPSISTDRWITTLPVVTRIGRHVFATKA